MAFTLFILQHLQNKFYSEYKSCYTHPPIHPATHPPRKQNYKNKVMLQTTNQLANKTTKTN